MNRERVVPGLLLAGVVAIVVARTLIAADTAEKMPPIPPPSTFAPADDLVAQVDYYIHRTEETLANPGDFDDAAKTRLKKDANTLTALALTLGMHDTENRVKPTAAALIDYSQELASADDYAAATAAFDRVKQAAAGKTVPVGAGDLKWERLASLGQLMKQVPTINAALKRGITPQRFETLQAQSAGHAAALAAIAQTVQADTHEVKNPADLEKWYQYCAEMRDAAGKVNASIRAGDRQATTQAMSRLAASCETCHAVFRKETN